MPRGPVSDSPRTRWVGASDGHAGPFLKIEAGERQEAAHELVEICRALEVTLLQLLSSARTPT